jgi:hypothetical protein
MSALALRRSLTFYREAKGFSVSLLEKFGMRLKARSLTFKQRMSMMVELPIVIQMSWRQDANLEGRK